MNLTKLEVEKKIETLDIRSDAWINDKFYQTEHNYPCISPIDGRLLTKVSHCSELEVNQAVLVAKESFNQGDWRFMAPTERKKVMLKFASLIEQNAYELALLEVLDVGKPIALSLDEILSAAESIRWTAEALDKVYGEIAPSHHNNLALVSKEPLGVIACIVPWNFPLAMACWKIGPALATGNSVILKPSEKSPLTAIKIGKLAKQAGLPAGIFQVLPGQGDTTGKALALHMDVDCIAFTGSTQTAKKLQIYAGQSNMKQVWIEAGGKSPLIIFSSFNDLDQAAKIVAKAIGFNQGQVCTAASRLIVEHSIYSELMDKVKEQLKTWYPSDPLQYHTKAGAIVDQHQMKKILYYIQEGISEGAELTYGGQQVLKDSGGYYFEPTIFEKVTGDMCIAQEEIFGPVLSVMDFKDEREAIKLANNTIYGLASGVLTGELKQAYCIAKKIQAGSIFVNDYFMGDMTVPFGGFKQSGFGRDKSLHSFNKYLDFKTTWINF